MRDLATQDAGIPAMSARAIQQVRDFEVHLLERPQDDLYTHHVLHAGMYARTIVLPPWKEMTGALVKVAVLLTIKGDCEVFLGEGWVRYTGYCVLPAMAGRKQAFRTLAETAITMTFPTQAKTVAEAEREFTDDVDRLASRREGAHNETVITGA